MDLCKVGGPVKNIFSPLPLFRVILSWVLPLNETFDAKFAFRGSKRNGVSHLHSPHGSAPGHPLRSRFLRRLPRKVVGHPQDVSSVQEGLSQDHQRFRNRDRGRATRDPPTLRPASTTRRRTPSTASARLRRRSGHDDGRHGSQCPSSWRRVSSFKLVRGGKIGRGEIRHRGLFFSRLVLFPRRWTCSLWLRTEKVGEN